MNDRRFLKRAEGSSFSRRAWVVAAVTTLIPSHLPAAQKTFRVGVIDPDAADYTDAWEGFLAELSRLGFVEGVNIVFERRSPSSLDPAGLDKAASELAALKVDLIYATNGTPAASAAKRATSRIPIVFGGSADPVGTGLVSSLSRPSGNMTGSSTNSFEIYPKALEFLCQLVPGTDRIVEFSPAGTNLSPWFARRNTAIQATAKSLGVRYEYVESGSIEQLEADLKRSIRQGLQAASISTSSFFWKHRMPVATLLIDNRIPSLGNPEAGFLLYYEISDSYLYKKAAQNIAKILNGSKPSDIPVEQPTELSLVINERTAKALGIAIPLSMRMRASRIIG